MIGGDVEPGGLRRKNTRIPGAADAVVADTAAALRKRNGVFARCREIAILDDNPGDIGSIGQRLGTAGKRLVRAIDDKPAEADLRAAAGPQKGPAAAINEAGCAGNAGEIGPCGQIHAGNNIGSGLQENLITGRARLLQEGIERLALIIRRSRIQPCGCRRKSAGGQECPGTEPGHSTENKTSVDHGLYLRFSVWTGRGLCVFWPID